METGLRSLLANSIMENVVQLLDAFSRPCIGWSLQRSLEAGLVLEALRMALRQRRPAADLVHHSDRGVQYA